jgi:hypothetical protein
MTDMPHEDKQQLATLVRDYGMLGVLRTLAEICGNWSREYDPSPATHRYAQAEAMLKDLADFLDRGSSAS